MKIRVEISTDEFKKQLKTFLFDGFHHFEQKMNERWHGYPPYPSPSPLSAGISSMPQVNLTAHYPENPINHPPTQRFHPRKQKSCNGRADEVIGGWGRSLLVVGDIGRVFSGEISYLNWKLFEHCFLYIFIIVVSLVHSCASHSSKCLSMTWLLRF